MPNISDQQRDDLLRQRQALDEARGIGIAETEDALGQAGNYLNSLTFSASSGGALPPSDDIASLPPKVQKLYWRLGNLALGTNAMSQAAKDNCGYYQYLIRIAREQGDMAALTQHIQAAKRYVNALIIAGNERRAKAERRAREQRHQDQMRRFREADAQSMEDYEEQQQPVNSSGDGGGGKYHNLSRAGNPLLFRDFVLSEGDSDDPPPNPSDLNGMSVDELVEMYAAEVLGDEALGMDAEQKLVALIAALYDVAGTKAAGISPGSISYDEMGLRTIISIYEMQRDEDPYFVPEPDWFKDNVIEPGKRFFQAFKNDLLPATIGFVNGFLEITVYPIVDLISHHIPNLIIKVSGNTPNGSPRLRVQAGDQVWSWVGGDRHW